MKLQLPSVTLVCMENANTRGAVELLHRMVGMCDFGAVRLLNWHRSYDAFNYMETQELWRYVTTDHCLTVHLDGYILHPELWEPDWLDFDYIGAPWPKTLNMDQVGNGGFCLRSRKLLNAVSALPYPRGGVGDKAYPADVLVCTVHRRSLLAAGMQFAPVDVAARFSVEHEIAETPPETFGFHAAIRHRGGFYQVTMHTDDTPHAVEARLYGSHEAFFSLQRTIEQQRCLLLRNGGRPDAVLLGPTAWGVVENYMRDSQHMHHVSYSPQICSIGALRVIRTMEEGVCVVQTWAIEDEMRRRKWWGEHDETPCPDDHPFNQTPTFAYAYEKSPNQNPHSYPGIFKGATLRRVEPKTLTCPKCGTTTVHPSGGAPYRCSHCNTTFNPPTNKS